MTTQLYLPADESQREFGTTLYKRSLKGRIIRELNKISSTKRREFEQLKTFPFLPNSGYAFIVGKKSWHGREPVPEGLGSRFSLMNIYYNRSRCAVLRQVTATGWINGRDLANCYRPFYGRGHYLNGGHPVALVVARSHTQSIGR